MSLLGGNSCQHGLESPVSLGPWRGAASAAVLPRVSEQSVCLLGFENSEPAPQKHCVNVKLLMSEKLLQLCSGLREEIIWCKVSPRPGTT